MTDAHGLIIGEVDPQPMRDLFRTPCRGPPTILPVRLIATFPICGLRPSNDRSISTLHRPVEAVLDVLAKPIVGDEFGDFRTLGRLLRFPLRHRRPVLLRAASCGGVATQLA